MRTARLTGDGLCYYHVVSRVIERRFALDDGEKERFRRLMRRVEAFTGVKVVTYAVLTNHVHLLLRVDTGATVGQPEVLRRMREYYEGKGWVSGYAQRVRAAREAGNAAEAERLLEAYRYRMNDLSEFMKCLMQRFTVSYNRRHERHGTLWEGRFKSVLVEGRGAALSMIAAYIDLNPVRAGIVSDPKQYRFCGYGEAVAGHCSAQEGLGIVLGALDQCDNACWDQQAYRTFVFDQGLTHQKAGTNSDAFRARAESALAQGGRLGRTDLLHCRVRYFCDGAVLGSRAFVQDVFLAHRSRFGVRRRNGPRPMRGTDLNELFTMRDLRRPPIIIPPPRSV